jgi:hypothetical protein
MFLLYLITGWEWLIPIYTRRLFRRINVNL